MLKIWFQAMAVWTVVLGDLVLCLHTDFVAAHHNINCLVP